MGEEERLVLEYERRDDGTAVLRLNGPLEQTPAAVLEGGLRGPRGQLSHVVIDLTAVDHIDSYGLDVLLETEADARLQRRWTVEVIGIQESLLSHRPPLDPAD